MHADAPSIRRARALALAVILLSATAACAAPATPSAPPQPASTTAGPAPTTEPQSVCTDVTGKGSAVGAAVLQFIGGQATAAQVAAAVQDLEAAVTAARAAASSELAPRLDTVNAAAEQLRQALQAQPLVPATVRSTAQQTLTAVKDLASVCAPGRSATPTASPTAGVTPTS